MSEQILKDIDSSNSPILLDFTGKYCSPCKAIKPVMEVVKSEFQSQMYFIEIDVEEHSDIAAKYNIMRIPTILLIKNGEVIEQVTGMVSKSNLEKLIKGVLND